MTIVGNEIDKKSSSQKIPSIKKRSRVYVVVVMLLLVLLFTFIFRGCWGRSAVEVSVSDGNDTMLVVTKDTSVQTVIDTPDVIRDTAANVDTIVVAKKIDTPVQPVKKNIAVVRDTAAQKELPQTTTPAISDTPSVQMDTSLQSRDEQCGDDTTDLWVYPDPSGGLHRESVTISFVTNRPATVQYRTGEGVAWTVYNGTPVTVEATLTLYYNAIDSCGKIMEQRSEYYEIEKDSASSLCEKSMARVKVGTMHFCIDRYEWPNRKGAKPDAYVSYYQAQDSCFSAGKRLCSSDEWAIACSGPYSWKYPYGKNYERYRCGTHDSASVPAGKRRECRSFFGVYDMSGNLAEWTSTKSVENSAFYYVMGGFWESGPKSGCFDKRYSYYPQNHHNPVGFRCCKDIAHTSPARSGKGK